VTSTTLVVVKIWWSQLRSSWHKQGWLYGSMLMARWLPRHCMLVVR